MSNFWKYFLFLLWISYLLVCGVLLFSRGFLLRRKVQPEKSTCVSNLYCHQPLHFQEVKNSSYQHSVTFPGEEGNCDTGAELLHNLSSKEDICSDGRAKVVLIVIDALRYDFVAYDTTPPASELPYQNRLTVIHDLLTSRPEKSRLYKFIADPPTTTMQRLKGLTAGSLPTFIEMSSNFAATEINEDNIIDQLLSKGKKAVFMGDDTWSGLYPSRFEREYPFPSFNVWDLDTADNGVKKHLLPEMKKKDWNFLIGHFLGVDHCGHRYGPLHTEMTRKLDEMNEVLRDVVDALDNNTVLYVIGDHGMTSTGDHGGATEEEVTAALFAYHPNGFLPTSWSRKGDTVNQVDLVPTLAAVLGIPIPFSNIGTVIIDALPQLDLTAPNWNKLPNWQFALLNVWANAKQAMTYIGRYAEHNQDFTQDKVNQLNEKFTVLSNRMKTVSTEEEFLRIASEANQFLTSLRVMCEEVWVQFDTFALTWGLVFTFIVLIVMFLIIEALPGEKLTYAASGRCLTLVYMTLAAAVVISYILNITGQVQSLELALYISSFGVSFTFLAIICAHNSTAIFTKWRSVARYKTWTDFFSRSVFLFTLWALSSNSFVVEESSVSSFFLLSLITALVYSYQLPWDEVMSGNSKTKSDKSSLGWLKNQVHPTRFRVIGIYLVLSVLIRLSHTFWRCREEQTWCDTNLVTKFSEPQKRSKISADPNCLAMVVCVALWVSVTRMWLRSCGNLTGYAPTVLFVRYVPTVLAVCSGGFWVLQGLPGETRNRLFMPWQLQILPWAVYAFIILTTASLIIRPLCIFVVTNRREASFSVQMHQNPIPQLYNQMKQMISGNKNASSQNGSTGLHLPNNRPVVYGLATAYSAAFIVLAILLVLVLSLLLGTQYAPGAVVMGCSSAMMLLLLAMIRFESALVSIQLLTVSWPAVLCWSLMAQNFFYGTGHQATFPTIQWEAAMVGTGGYMGSSNIMPALLIIANTFASHIYMSLLLPLLLITPLTIHVMVPRWASVPVGDQELSQGELMMFQRESFAYRTLTTLTARYIFLQGIRSMACMVAATIHARHLMVWKIFAPKFIFEALSLFVTLPCVLLAFLLFGRVSKCVGQLLEKYDTSASNTKQTDENKSEKVR